VRLYIFYDNTPALISVILPILKTTKMAAQRRA